MSSPPTTPPARAPSDPAELGFCEKGYPCEWAEDYRPGSFHPIHLDDTFKDGQYRVIRKLGDGSFSTVWLAVDNKYVSRNTRYVAMKVMMSKHSSVASTELRICHQLAEASSSNRLGSKHVVGLLDSFEHAGPNGSHLCLVYQPMGGTVASMVEKLPEHSNTHGDRYGRYPVWMVKNILRHVLSGLAFLHQNGVVHGDVQPGNFLFSARNLDSIKETELRQMESHITMPLERRDGKMDKWAPKYLMLGQQLYKYADLGPEMFIKISDFGAAFWSTNPPIKTVTPIALRAPEIIFSEPIDSSIDIWSFGCLVYELLTREQLFPVWMIHPITQEEADDDHLMGFNDILQPLPDSWLAKWPRSHRFIGPNRERLHPDLEAHLKFDKVEGGTIVKGSGAPEPDDSGGNSEHNDMTPIDGAGDDAAGKVKSVGEEDGEPFVSEPLEALFEENKPADMSASEAQTVTSLIRQILRYDPSERPTAAQLLEHEWFRDYA